MADGITYREDFKLWWPDYDHKPEKCYGAVMHDLHWMDFAIAHAPNHGICVQAGGHVGMWPKKLAKHFAKVYTFEPEKKLFECMRRNIDGVSINIIMADKALGPEVCPVKLKSHCSAGSWQVREDGDHEVAQISIDYLMLESCGAIFLDIEGYELEAIKGARETIAKYKPIIHLECPNGRGQWQRDFMRTIGYDVIHGIGRDLVYGHSG